MKHRSLDTTARTRAKHPVERRISYLLARLHARKGHTGVLVSEIVKAVNARPMRRIDDPMRVRGWTIVEPQS